MNKVLKIVSGAVFITGFVGVALLSGHRTTASAEITDSPIVSLIKSVRQAQEAQAINEGRWTANVYDLQQDSLTEIEKLLAEDSAKDTLLAVQN
ncbi:MAG: hypothetical protein IT289_10110 [Oligoflexia bacterium]|nr:hypothetical protein [Oligoflexia bacterium]